MKALVIAVILVFSSSAFAQKTFELKDASKFFDIKINVATCDEVIAAGRPPFPFIKGREHAISGHKPAEHTNAVR